MTWIVVITHPCGSARLSCISLEEAHQVRQSFVNWGGMGYDIEIVAETQQA